MADVTELEKRIIDRIEKEAAALAVGFHERFSGIDRRLDGIEQRLDRIESQVKRTRELLGVVEEEGNLGFVRQRVEAVQSKEQAAERQRHVEKPAGPQMHPGGGPRFD